MNTPKCETCNTRHNGTYGSGRFCSRSCSNTRVRSTEFKNNLSKKLSNKPRPYRIKPRIKTNCYVCNKEIQFTQAELKAKPKRICGSKQCIKESMVINGKKVASKNIKRSKDEVKLYKLCKYYFSNISHNTPLANGWDADILLHDYKIAILWNGPWHYKEMGLSNHSLNQVQTRDKIKIQEFNKIGWEVIVFEDRFYTPNTAFLLLFDRLVARKGYDPFTKSV